MSSNTAVPSELAAAVKEATGAHPLHEIARGGYGTVILAELAKCRVAVKVMDKVALAKQNELHRAYVEVLALQLLEDCPFVVPLLQLAETDRYLMLVMEAVPTDMAAHLDIRQRYSEPVARRLFAQIAVAIATAHQRHVCMRDIKLDNIMLDASMNVRIIDFGLAAILTPVDEQEPHPTVISPEKSSCAHKDGLAHPELATCCGTRSYSAPEVLGLRPYDGFKADLWSLGCLLFAMLTGFPPFEDDIDDGPARLRRQHRQQIAHPPYMSQECIDLLDQLLQHDPQARPDMAQVLCHPFVSSSLPDELPPDLRQRHMGSGARSRSRHVLFGTLRRSSRSSASDASQDSAKTAKTLLATEACLNKAATLFGIDDREGDADFNLLRAVVEQRLPSLPMAVCRLCDMYPEDIHRAEAGCLADAWKRFRSGGEWTCSSCSSVLQGTSLGPIGVRHVESNFPSMTASRYEAGGREFVQTVV